MFPEPDTTGELPFSPEAERAFERTRILDALKTKVERIRDGDYDHSDEYGNGALHVCNYMLLVIEEMRK